MTKTIMTITVTILSLLLFSCAVEEEPGEMTDDLTVTDTAGGDDGDTATASCGDNITNGTDVCDGDAVDCTTLGDFTGGLAVCKSNCTGYDTTNCLKETTDDATVTDSDIPGATDDGTVISDEDPGVFDKNASGFWTDPATFLIWEEPMGNKGAGGVGPTHANAEKYCNDLVLAGAKDWRLPTIDELRTLVRGVSTTMTGGKCPTTEACTNQDTCNKDKDNTQGFGNSCLGCQALADTYDPAFSYLESSDCQLSDRQLTNLECYRVSRLTGPCDGDWSATPNTSATGTQTKAFWYLNFKRALINSDADMLSGANWVRCIRAGTADDIPEGQTDYPPVASGECIRDLDCPIEKYCVENQCILIPEDTWLDSASGLTWQTFPTKKTWADGLAYCDALDLGGQSDWRLPTIDELKTLSSCAATAACGITDACAGYTSCNGGSADCKGCASGNYLPEILGLDIQNHWSATEETQTATENAWTLNFSTSKVGYLDKGWEFTVRCVR